MKRRAFVAALLAAPVAVKAAALAPAAVPVAPVTVSFHWGRFYDVIADRWVTRLVEQHDWIPVRYTDYPLPRYVTNK